MKRKVIYGLLIVAVLALSLYSGYVGSLEKAMDRAEINYNQIVHTVGTENGTVVFYHWHDSLGVGLIDKSLFGYKWISGGGVEYDSSGDMSPGFINLGKSLEKGQERFIVPVAKDFISNKDIDKVQLIINDDQIIEPTIVSTDKIKFWYAILDEPGGRARVIGYNSDNDIVFDTKPELGEKRIY
ncbi:hypothetical protein HYG86_15090 [Alkalicella caledoniensis]|uniref:Uncharacterized protein n=1 Tax=Alkalicella caledoniensis TaxID=2731377 RepID=A0A7G9WBD7_ALKCA|nr:hypothetical protein [Alkalicella caledoniensis]QNO15999.1 hypothetical protein HYG86_15090 [Alkalicella caledoniensis]